MLAEVGTEVVESSHSEREAIIRDLLLLAPHTEIVHHIQGRIRLRLKRSGLEVVKKTNIEKLMDSIPGIQKIRINPVVGSLILEYDANRLPYSLWEKLGEIRTRPELSGVVREVLQGLWK